MIQLTIATAFAAGVFLIYSSFAFARTQGSRPLAKRRTATQWLHHAGLYDVQPAEFMGVAAALMAASGSVGYVIFGTAAPAGAIALTAGVFLVGSYRHRAVKRRNAAHEAWPRLIEEMRILIGSAGRSIPNALFDAGRNGPEEIQDAFAESQREWLLTTDFDRTLTTLKSRLADPTVDMVCETLLIAHDVGGTDADSRLASLAEDRRVDAQGRRDAAAQQAGAKFARRFVLLVPFGMAIAGMSVGNGRDAYGTGAGQIMVLAALALIAVCWAWAGRIMALPEEGRVFSS
jgi:tight adherence protein B